MNLAKLRLIALFVLIIGAVELRAQTPPASDSASTPVFRANARDVVVDVVVTQGHGQAVSGLQAKDFAVLEDGKPQTLDYFEEHRSKALPVGALPALPQMPPNVFTNVPRAPVDDAVTVLLLDSLNTPPQMESYARNETLAYLNKVKPGTRMAIVVLNDKLNFVQGFTSDAALLREIALKQTAPGVSPSLVTKSEVGAEQELESFLSSNGLAGAPMIATSAVAAAFSSYQNYKSANRTRMTLEALSDIARYLAAVPERKNLIWFAGDFPVQVFPKFDQMMNDENNAIRLRDVRKAADLLTAARVAVYPVYANGMMSDDIVSSDNRSPGSAAGPGRMSDMAGMDNYNSSNGDHAGTIASMNQIASDTGGKAFYNTNDLATAVDTAITDGSHYYTLVYSPTNKKMDGSYRHVEIKTPGQKVQLSYRRGYNASETSSNATKTAANPLQPLLIRGLPGSTQILFAARVLPAEQQPAANAPLAGRNPKLARPVRRYTVDLMIRWTDIKLDEASDGKHTGQIEVELMAYDRDGHTVNWAGGTQSMSVDPQMFESIKKSGVPAHLEIDLPANQPTYLEAGVYDWGTGKAGTLEVPIAAPNSAVPVQSGH
ncbi:MAG: VWA domain-containing protein [Terracidiphilus sp.]|nr:VWA domain-containing protein [Terracidiphilus sp.]